MFEIPFSHSGGYSAFSPGEICALAEEKLLVLPPNGTKNLEFQDGKLSFAAFFVVFIRTLPFLLQT